MKYTINYKSLKNYLKTLQPTDFETSYNKNQNALIKEGFSVLDIEFFKKDKSKIKFDSIIDVGTPFLVDALGNDLSILILSKRKYTLPNGRVVNAKFDTTLIDDCRKIYGTPLNGFWIIPDSFLNIKK